MFTQEMYYAELNADPVFSHAEVQQLREVLREKIDLLEELCEVFKYNASYYKQHKPEVSSRYWSDIRKARAKIKKLAALQTKLKSFDALY